MKEYKLYICSKCGDGNYGDLVAKIDNKIYCDACWNDEIENIENKAIKESFQQLESKASNE